MDEPVIPVVLPASAGLSDLVTRDEAYARRYDELIERVKTTRFTDLKSLYTAEFNSWNNRKHWSKKHQVEWAKEMETFSAFLIVVGPIPIAGDTLDRINPSGAYVPDNLRWADKGTQSQNRRNAREIVIGGVRRTLRSVAEAVGRKYDAVRMGLNRRGIGYIEGLIAAPNSKPAGLEENWQFPLEFRAGLQDEYASYASPGESRIRFFIRLTKTEFYKLQAERWNSSDNPDVRDTLNQLVILHNRAADDLQVLKKMDRQAKLYANVKAPAVVWNIEPDHPEFVEAMKNPALLRVD